MQKNTMRTDAFLWAAKRIFLDGGYDGVSMDAVAEAAGTTKRTLYNHFGSKEQLFEAVVRYVATLSAGNLPAPETLSPDPNEAVTQFCLRYAYWSCFTDAVAMHRLVIALAPRFPRYAEILYGDSYLPAETQLARYVAAHFSPEAVAPWGTATILARSLMDAVSARRYPALLGKETPYPAPTGNAPHEHLPDEPLIRHLVTLYLGNGSAP